MRRSAVLAGQRLAGLVLAALSGVALLAGCSAEKQQASTELPAASSTSAEPTPELPPLGPPDFPVPEEARVQDEAGAEAFLRYYVELLNRQQAIPSGEGIDDLGPECVDCKAIARRFEQAAQAGHSIRGGELSVIGEPGTAFFEDRVEFSFLAELAAVAAYDSSGQVVPDSRYPKQQGLSSGLGLVWSEDRHGWLVAGLTLG